MRASLSDVMEGRATDRSGQLVPDTGDELRVLAVDRVRRYGAAFCFGLGDEGLWYSEALHAHQDDTGRWLDMGGGGSHGDGWEPPWRPPENGWDGESLLIMGTAGQTVYEDEEEKDLLSVVGFAVPSVRALWVEETDGRRQVEIVSPLGAFVALHVGRGAWSVTTLTSAGSTGETRRFP